MKRVVLGAVGVILFCFMQSFAQGYPATIWVPVTYYDFRADGTNPEFECNIIDYPAAVHREMVRDTLGADGNPIVTADDNLISRNAFIKYWFIPWLDSRNDSTIPQYNASNPFRYIGTTHVNYDTAFKNLEFKDSLLFSLVLGSQGTYTYINDKFFPLDNRGFGAEGRRDSSGNLHNFSFTMKIHWTFSMRQGLTFDFGGDDDVWAFVDNRLQMDLGGLHTYEPGFFNVDSISNLTQGNNYSFDFFFAERHTSESHIKITTNIITAKPDRLFLSTDTSGGRCAGDTIRLFATVQDDSGHVRPDFSQNTTWSFIHNGGNADSTLFPSTLRGDTIRFAPTEAWDSVYIEGTLDAGYGITLRDTVGIWITACHPDHLIIEGSIPTTGSALRDDTPLSELLIASIQPSNFAFAVLRDKFGNYVSPSQNTLWDITQGLGTIIDRVEKGDTTTGQGIVYKKGPSGTGEISAQNTLSPYTGPKFTDSVRVRVDSVSYNALRISVTNNGISTPISNLTIQSETDTLLIVEGRRADGLGWDLVPGNWNLSATLSSSTTPALSSQTWNFSPTDTGHGTISSTYLGLTTNILVTVTPGGPERIDLFPSSTTAIQFANPPGIGDTVRAGDTLPIFARIFDHNNVRLTSFDTTTSPITWTIREISGLMTPPTGSLSGTGNRTNFLPTVAYNYIQVTATFNQGIHIFSDSVRLYTIPGVSDHISIQTDTVLIRTPSDLSQITFDSRDSSKLLYPVLRDRYNNPISFAEQASWFSRDTTIANASATDRIFKGEGIIERKTDSTRTTWAVVTSSSTPALKDSILVSLTNITYDSLQIYIIDNGIKTIDTLSIRSDAQQTLYARGKRSDGRGWDNLEVKWNISSGLSVTGVPPQSSSNWPVIPTMVDTGKIYITRTGSVADTITAIFLPGLAGNMSLYRREGQPTTSLPYSVPPRVDTLVAGSIATFDAKIFDRNNTWLSGYENSTISKNLISWELSRIDGPGTSVDSLTTNTGHLITFTPKNAYSNFRITAYFKEGSTSLTAQATVYVIPGLPTHLVIEAIPNPTGNFLVNDNPIDTVFFDSRDTVKAVFGILRDKDGNFTGQSKSTDWLSHNVNIVKASEEIAAIGQGKIVRIDTAGITTVGATSRNNVLFTDNVIVKINSFSYDSLRILVDTRTNINSLIIGLGSDTLLQVQGKRSFDGVWVPVDANWHTIISNIKTDGPTNQSWDFSPTDTGVGFVYVTMGKTPPDTLAVTVIPGKPFSLSIYNKEGSDLTSGTIPLKNLPDSISITTDSLLPLVAKIFEKNKIWLSEYETDGAKSATINWSLEEIGSNKLSGKLSQTAGHKISFDPDSAYRSVYIIATMPIDPTHNISDTVKVRIVPGKPKMLVLEASPNWEANETHSAPIDTVKIQESVPTARVYAMLRDSKGNFVRYSLSTQWGIVNNDTIISVRNGTTTLGEGVIERNTRGISKVFAIDVSGLRDTAVVQLLDYYYKNLRIVAGTDTTIQKLIMNTNQDTLVHVQGLRSDKPIWEYINNAQWTNTPSLNNSIQSPGVSSVWRLDPKDTATGKIIVSMESDLRTAPDTLDVQFIVGPPVRVTIKIVTPKDSLIAGEPITALLNIFNKDGLVPGSWCFDAKDIKYTDVIGTGTGRPRPFVLIGKDILYLSDKFADTSKTQQCFFNGTDTISLRIFNVPTVSDSTHKITVTLGSLVGTTPPFNVLPAKLDSIVLERNGVPLKDTLALSYLDNNVIVTAIGYDKYGNRRIPEVCNWTADSALPQIHNPLRVTRIIYDASGTIDNSTGVVKANSNEYPDIQGKVVIKLAGPLNTIKAAITRDGNGNGLLDGIDLVFSKKITIPDRFEFSEIKICHEDNCFKVDSIYSATGKTDSIWHIAIREIETKKPQTNWTLTISSPKVDSLQIDAVNNFSTTDGAGPVIWSVTKEIVDLENRTKDIVTVEFSEPVVRTIDGSTPSIADSPFRTFYVWELNTNPNDTNKYVLIDSILTGINNINNYKDNLLTFTTTNGYDVSSRNYMSLNDSTPYVKDVYGNLPVIKNNKAIVLIINSKPPRLVSVPNPTTPTFNHVGPGIFNIVHERRALKWVHDDNAGTVLTFSIAVPNRGEENVKLRCRAKIHDLAGNIVISNINEDLLGTIPAGVIGNASKYNIDLYWNGSNSNKMMVAPGIYKAVIYLEYYGATTAQSKSRFIDSRITSIIGIGR